MEWTVNVVNSKISSVVRHVHPTLLRDRFPIRLPCNMTLETY